MPPDLAAHPGEVVFDEGVQSLVFSLMPPHEER